MRKLFAMAVAGALSAATATVAHGAQVDVIGGRTSVALDAETLQSSAGLTISSTSPEVQSPGDLPDSVAFPINARNAAVRPTSFSYDTDDFAGSASGTIEHTGTVQFNADAISVGNFTIGFDGTRAGTLGGLASGFFVQSNTAASNAVLFDVATPSTLSALAESLTIDADLLVSPEFASFLQTGGLATTDLSGADVGNARVAAISQVRDDGGTVIPLPPALVPGAILLMGLAGGKSLRGRLRPRSA